MLLTHDLWEAERSSGFCTYKIRTLPLSYSLKIHVQLNVFPNLQLSVQFNTIIKFHIYLLLAPFSWNMCTYVSW